MIGLEHGIVKLYPYNSEWKRVFTEEKIRIQAIIGKYILDIQHIGSTAIPGLISKPIIDIAVAVSNFEEAKICIDPLNKLEYEYKGEFGIPRRHFFVKGDPRLFHLHMLEIASMQWKNHILFRDYLREHPDKSKLYADLKLQLALQYSNDREAYSDAKAPFIQEVLRLSSFKDHPEIKK